MYIIPYCRFLICFPLISSSFYFLFLLSLSIIFFFLCFRYSALCIVPSFLPCFRFLIVYHISCLLLPYSYLLYTFLLSSPSYFTSVPHSVSISFISLAVYTSPYSFLVYSLLFPSLFLFSLLLRSIFIIYISCLHLSCFLVLSTFLFLFLLFCAFFS